MDTERLERAREYAAREHQRLLLLIAANNPAEQGVYLSATAPVSSFTNLANLSIFNRIYIGSVQFDLTEDDIRETFGVFGPVKSLAMMMDAVAKRHRGYGFIEFETPEAASLALHSMHNTIFGQRHIKCGRPNNFPGEIPPSVPKPPPERLYVSNVHEMISEDELKAVFEAFGPVRACRLVPDFDVRLHKRYGYVEFEDAAHAALALQALHRFELAGRNLQVGRCVVGGPMIGGMQLLNQLKPGVKLPSHKEHLIPSAVFKAVENINTTLSVLSQPLKPVPSADTPTVVRIENLEDPSMLQTEQERADLEADVREECSKYGTILDMHCMILGGLVVMLIKYMTEGEAQRCLQVMQGRWFAGRQLQARIYDLDRYDSGDYE